MNSRKWIADPPINGAVNGWSVLERRSLTGAQCANGELATRVIAHGLTAEVAMLIATAPAMREFISSLAAWPGATDEFRNRVVRVLSAEVERP